MSFLTRLLFVVLFAGILSCIIFFTPPPKTWETASITQILSLFIPLLLLFTGIINLLLNHIMRSFAFGLGLMFITTLQSLDKLNIVTIFFVVILTILLYRFLPNRGLTIKRQINKLMPNRRSGEFRKVKNV